MKFSYQVEKFSSARSSLMLPHPEGEAKSLCDAFRECSLGLHNFDESLIQDDNALNNIRKIKESMNSSGLNDQEEKGLWRIKAESLSEEEKYDFSNAVDELASYFCQF